MGRRNKNVNGELKDGPWSTKLLSPRPTLSVQHVEKNIKIHHRNTGYSVTDVRTGGMKLAQRMNQASLHATTVLLNKLCKLLSLY
jgi:hypothetical protein